MNSILASVKDSLSDDDTLVIIGTDGQLKAFAAAVEAKNVVHQSTQETE